MIVQLRNVLAGSDSTPEGCSGVLEYFFEKLTQSQLTPRKLALKVSISTTYNNSTRHVTSE